MPATSAASSGSAGSSRIGAAGQVARVRAAAGEGEDERGQCSQRHQIGGAAEPRSGRHQLHCHQQRRGHRPADDQADDSGGAQHRVAEQAPGVDPGRSGRERRDHHSNGRAQRDPDQRDPPGIGQREHQQLRRSGTAPLQAAPLGRRVPAQADGGQQGEAQKQRRGLAADQQHPPAGDLARVAGLDQRLIRPGQHPVRIARFQRGQRVRLAVEQPVDLPAADARRQRLAPVEGPVGRRQSWHQRHRRDVACKKRRRRLARPGGLAQVRRRAERQCRPQDGCADGDEPRALGRGLVQRRAVHLQHLAALGRARPRQPAAGQPDVAADVVDRPQQHDAVIEPQGAIQHRRRRLAGSQTVQRRARPAVGRRVVLDRPRVGDGQRTLARGQPVDRPVERAL